MLAEFRKRPIRWSLGAVVAVVTGTWPWMVTSAQPFAAWLADWLPIIVAGLSAGGVTYLWLQYNRYRDGLRKVVRDYIVDVADLNTRLDPDQYGPMSDGVKRGEETADPVWGNKILAKYGLPPEKEFR